MRYQKFSRIWGFCVLCSEDYKQITTSNLHPHNIYCDDCKVNKKEEYDARLKKMDENAEKLILQQQLKKEEKERKYEEELEKEEEHYQYLADNQQEDYEEWLNSEYGDDAETAYWNNE